MALYCIFLLLVFYHKVYSVEISSKSCIYCIFSLPSIDPNQCLQDSGYEDIPPFSTVINFCEH